MKQEILNIAINNLSSAAGIMAEVDQTNLHHDKLHDGYINFFLGDSSFGLPFSIKKSITLAQLPFLQDDALDGGLIIFEYASKPVKEQLRRLKINYLDTKIF